MKRSFTDQELVRREKVELLKEKGVKPFGQSFKRLNHSQEIIEKYAAYSKEELEALNAAVVIAGRIMTKREMGKAGFMHIQDRNGQIQVYLRQDTLPTLDFTLFSMADIGDIVGIGGKVFRTNHGELSVKAESYTHLTKALKPLPEKFHGLTDIEERYRRRYLDLIMNESSKEKAIMRAKIVRAIQNYLDSQGLIEVETPVLQPILGGAAARPFVTHHNALDRDFYLRIATELPLKRLIVGGLEGVYEIGRLFRNEGMDYKHNPEFTTVEAYVAYSDIYGMMELTEGIISAAKSVVTSEDVITWEDKPINLKTPFARKSMVAMIKEACGIDFSAKLDYQQALALAKKHNIKVEKHHTGVGHIIALFFEEFVEKTIVDPVFVYGYPVEISPLAKRSEEDERFTDRFELFIDGSEYCNAFSELNDPIDQFARFEAQIKEKQLGNEEANEMDLDFVEALEYGLPPTGGLGLGIDRLVMLLTNTTTIRDVILFPHMRQKPNE